MSVSKLDLGPGRCNSTGDLLLKSANMESAKEIDVLIFTDSRGACLESMDSGWASRLFESLKKKKISTLLVVRPKDCTVFLTLINFLRLNTLRIGHLIAQIGLVDFTPKKSEIIDDILLQRSAYFKSMEFRIEKLRKYRLSSGVCENLYSIKFDTGAFRMAIADHLGRHCRRVTLVGALEVRADLKVKRKRPPEFFSKLKGSNGFLAGLQKISGKIGYLQPIDSSEYEPNDHSRDGVHYTRSGHRLVSDSILDICVKHDVITGKEGMTR